MGRSLTQKEVHLVEQERDELEMPRGQLEWVGWPLAQA